MIHCPACGQALPPQANFCARCGGRLPGRAIAAWWILALFAVGSFLTLYSTVSSALSIYFEPTIAGDPSKVAASVILTVFSLLLTMLQVAAIIGLARNRSWGRMAATIACAGWVMTCIGIPLSIFVLRELWRVRTAPIRG